MFCTHCASLNPDSTYRCLTCGAPLLIHADQPGRNLPGLKTSSSHAHMADAGKWILLLVPFVIAVMVGGWLGWHVYRDHEERASAYNRAAISFESGDLKQAIEQFGEAGTYRDAPERRITAQELLAPYRAAYLEGISAVELEDYARAITVLAPVVDAMPNDVDAADLLKEAQIGLREDLERQSEIAIVRHEWLAADHALSSLASLDPESSTFTRELADLREDHAPIIFARAGALYQIGPDLADEKLLFKDLPVSSPIWNPDRSRIAFYSTVAGAKTFGSLFVLDADGTNLQLISQFVHVDSLPSWSPDGQHIAFIGLAGSPLERVSQSAPHIFNLESGEGRTIEMASFFNTSAGLSDFIDATSPTWSPDGKRIAFVALTRPLAPATGVISFRGSVIVFDASTGALEQTYPDQIPAAAAVSWSPAADQLLVWEAKGGTALVNSRESAIYLIDLPAETVDRLTARTQTPGRPSWSPDGKRFAFVDGSTVIRVRWGSGLREASIGISRPIRSDLSWAPGGAALIASSADPAQPSSIVPMPDGPGSPSDLPVLFDDEFPNVGLQWGPRTPPDPSLLSPVSGSETAQT